MVRNLPDIVEIKVHCFDLISFQLYILWGFFFPGETIMNRFNQPSGHRTPLFTRTPHLGISKHDLERDSGFSGLIHLHCSETSTPFKVL